jgi:hypothetical protein
VARGGGQPVAAKRGQPVAARRTAGEQAWLDRRCAGKRGQVQVVDGQVWRQAP